MSSRKFFGTDGIRGRVGEYPITAEFVLKLGWAVGQVLGKGEGGKALIGKDTRISGYMFESALEAGLAAAGMDVHLLGPMPTPGIAYLTRTFRADVGVVISASHNPFFDNGIKFFTVDGKKLPDEVELEIEAMMEQPMTTVAPEILGKAKRVDDAYGRYIEFCKASVPGYTSLSGLKIVIDCANGATYHIAPNVFSEMGAEVVSIGNRPDGLNINDNCGATDTRLLAEKVLSEEADLGIAFDGDGDRVMMVDHKGEALDGDQLLFIIARDAQRSGRLGEGVVGTLMSNFGLEQAFAGLGIPFVRAKVGDRYVLEQLHDKGWFYGGESSGHIICLHANTTGDGVVSALQVLSVMVANGLSLNELKSGMTKMPQTMINVSMQEKQDPMQLPEVQKAVAEVEQTLGETGRVLLRPSGTEPVVRVMVEGEDAGQVRKLCESLAEKVSAFV